MNVKEKLKKRRDKISPLITVYVGVDETKWKKKPHPQWCQGFNALSPTWILMYEALKKHAPTKQSDSHDHMCPLRRPEESLSRVCTCWETITLAEADKFLKGTEVNDAAGVKTRCPVEVGDTVKSKDLEGLVGDLKYDKLYPNSKECLVDSTWIDTKNVIITYKWHWWQRGQR